MKRSTKKSKKGFTLIELIIVIAILAILALIAIPAYNAYRTNAKIEADKATAKIVYDAALVAHATSVDTDTWATYVDANSYDDTITPVVTTVSETDLTPLYATYNGQSYPVQS